MKTILFIDRDGTILQEPEDEQIDRWDKFVWLPGVIYNLRRIVELRRFELVLVTNQDGLGTAAFPASDFQPLQDFMLATLASEGIRFAAIHIDRSMPADNLPTRKPGTAMLKEYIDNPLYDLRNSYVIGDRESDVQLARNLGCKALRLVREDTSDTADVWHVTSWEKIYEHLTLPARKAHIIRESNETAIEIDINLDGKGVSNIDTGIGFFDHMLDLFAHHAGIDLHCHVKGDLHVDEHHTVEDTAIVIGQALARALGSKIGLRRYGFVLPMDEARALIALDFSGRAELRWDVVLKREKIGSLPTELLPHFFKSLCQHAGLTLHVEASGANEHHIVEAIFKGFGRSLRQALERDPEAQQIPSTKGIL
jgi:imidazoleglycerol-phosphate dehydratase/histidinol-phosphatase